MTQFDFEFEMKRLFNRYGEKFFPPQLNELLWGELSHLSSHWFSGLITVMIGEQRVPKLSEFRAAIGLESNRAWREKHTAGSEVRLPSCSDCNEGIVIVDRAVFKCLCESGRMRKENYPLYKKKPLRIVD